MALLLLGLADTRFGQARRGKGGFTAAFLSFVALRCPQFIFQQRGKRAYNAVGFRP